jgi:hypothetical protein
MAAPPSTTFAWRPGSHITARASIVGPELLRLAGDRGVEGLDAKEVVEAARPRSSPLHAAIYKLNDGAAAYQHRLHLARMMLNSLIVVVTIDKQDPIQYRPFVSIGDGLGYRSSVAVEGDEDLREQRVATALGYLRAARKMLAEAHGFSVVVVALTRIEARIERGTQKVKMRKVS